MLFVFLVEFELVAVIVFIFVVVISDDDLGLVFTFLVALLSDARCYDDEVTASAKSISR